MTERLRDALVAAVNGNPISADLAWELIRKWDAQVCALEQIATGAESNPPHEVARLACSALGLRASTASEVGSLPDIERRQTGGQEYDGSLARDIDELGDRL